MPDIVRHSPPEVEEPEPVRPAQPDPAPPGPPEPVPPEPKPPQRPIYVLRQAKSLEVLRPQPGCLFEILLHMVSNPDHFELRARLADKDGNEIFLLPQFNGPTGFAQHFVAGASRAGLPYTIQIQYRHNAENEWFAPDLPTEVRFQQAVAR